VREREREREREMEKHNIEVVKGDDGYDAVRTIRTSKEREKVTGEYVERARNMKKNEIREMFRKKRTVFESLGLRLEDVLPVRGSDDRYHKFRKKKHIRNVLLRMERTRRAELLGMCLFRLHEIKASESQGERKDKSSAENSNVKSPYMIDDALEEEIARKRRKKQIDMKAKQRLARAKEKRKKMHAVVCRSHNMRLKEIEEKRAAHERLKEDIVFSRKKSNSRVLRRVQKVIDEERKRDETRRFDLQKSLNERFSRIEISRQEKQDELDKIRSRYWV